MIKNELKLNISQVGAALVLGVEKPRTIQNDCGNLAVSVTIPDFVKTMANQMRNKIYLCMTNIDGEFVYDKAMELTEENKYTINVNVPVIANATLSFAVGMGADGDVTVLPVLTRPVRIPLESHFGM